MDETMLRALRKYGWIFCPINFLLLYLSNTGSALSLTLLTPKQLRSTQENSPRGPCRRTTAGLQVHPPTQHLRLVKGQRGAAMDEKSLSRGVHPPDRAGKMVKLDKWCVGGMR